MKFAVKNSPHDVQTKGGGGQRPFEQCSKKLHFSYGTASLSPMCKFIKGGRCEKRPFYLKSLKMGREGVGGQTHYYFFTQEKNFAI